ncbi:MAG TPA: hypothetical protein VGI71_23665 [Scandinavium sp.]|jgi:hypothetical protein
MKNIDRMYYPLNEAAEKMNFNVQDLLHLGATGRMEICAYIPKTTTNAFSVQVRENGEFVYEQIKKRAEVWDKFYLIENVSFVECSRKAIMFECQADTLSGFFALHSQDIVKFEFNRKDDFEIETTSLMTPYTSGYDFHLFDVQGVKITKNNLVVMAVNLEDFNSSQVAKRPGEGRGDDKKSVPNINKQARLIKTLIRIHYGERDANNPRGLLEPGGELLNDLDKLGIRPPVSGKSLKTWLEDVELEYVEISKNDGDISENH